MKKLFWLDMEMSGLDVNKEVIIEVAAIITDWNFKELDSFEAVVKQPQHYLDNMDEWNTEHHGESGLTAKVPLGMEPTAVEHHLVQLATKHFPDQKDRPVLCGNSIAQDRLFIDKYFKNFSKLLHYRVIDVTSWKLPLFHKFGITYNKNNNHRALDDVRESIQEMQFYSQFINPNAAKQDTKADL